MGEWMPSARMVRLASRTKRSPTEDLSRPYPFYLASPLECTRDAAERLGDLAQWQFEWKWDGIRAQLVKRGGASASVVARRGAHHARVSRRSRRGRARLPDGTVLDGEVLAFRDERPLPFSALQQRIGRQKQVARKARDVPVVFMAYDSSSTRAATSATTPLATRRAMLETLVSALTGVATPTAPANCCCRSTDAEVRQPIEPSPLLAWRSLDELAALRAESRAHGVEGLMLKRRDSPYGVGRKRGDWWKWKIDPFTIDAVLIYAQPGIGKRASLLTDYTFGVWDDGELVPVAKAYSGLTNEEIAELDRWIRRHTVERFGPVRHVEPVHVFELGFEAIAPIVAPRSGVAVRFPAHAALAEGQAGASEADRWMRSRR